MKRQDVMTSNVACHVMLWTKNSNEHPKTRDHVKVRKKVYFSKEKVTEKFLHK